MPFFILNCLVTSVVTVACSRRAGAQGPGPVGQGLGLLGAPDQLPVCWSVSMATTQLTSPGISISNALSFCLHSIPYVIFGVPIFNWEIRVRV